jgi:hypothetical protein
MGPGVIDSSLGSLFTRVRWRGEKKHHTTKEMGMQESNSKAIHVEKLNDIVLEAHNAVR